METETIPNLWPEIKVDVITPYAILQSQASRLSEATRGLLRAEVVSIKVDDRQKGYDFDIIAPVLNKYRHTLLSVDQIYDFAYPVTVEGIAAMKDGGQVWRHDIKPVAQIASAMRKNLGEFSAQDNVLIYTDDAFIKRVGEILQSPQAQALIYALIARSNEQTEAQATTQKHKASQINHPAG